MQLSKKDRRLASWEEIKMLNPDSGLERVLDTAGERSAFQETVGVSENRPKKTHPEALNVHGGASAPTPAGELMLVHACFGFRKDSCGRTEGEATRSGLKAGIFILRSKS